MINKKVAISLSIVFCVISVFFSCSKKVKTVSSKTDNTNEVKKIVIGFSIDTLAIERWRRDCDIFLNTVKEMGAEVIVQNAGNSVEEQIRQIQYLVNRKVDAIVIVAKKNDSLTETIKLARSKNIPVIAYDRLINDADINLYLTIDSERVGELMAKELLRLAPHGTWYCIYGPSEDYNMTLINRGVKSALRGTPVNIGYVYYTDGWNYDLSYKEMAKLLKNGSIPDAVISGNDAVANSVIQAISEICPDKKIAVSGQDADIAGCQNIVLGRQAVTVYKPITLLAEKAAYCAVELAKGKNASELTSNEQTINNGFGEIPVIWLSPTAVTKSNIDDVVIKSGFHTHGEIYRD